MRYLKENRETIDIREDYLLKKDDLLNSILQDKTTGNNILWPTDSYEQNSTKFTRIDFGLTSEMMQHLVLI